MGYGVWFGERLQIETIWVPTVLAPAEIEQSAIRLRGWALVRGATMRGSPFLSLSPSGDPRVYLPLARRVVPHLDSGIAPETLPAGPIAVVRDVPFERLLDHIKVLAQWLGPYGACRAHAEYQGAFNGSGLLTLPLDSLPTEGPPEPVTNGGVALSP